VIYHFGRGFVDGYVPFVSVSIVVREPMILLKALLTVVIVMEGMSRFSFRNDRRMYSS